MSTAMVDGRDLWAAAAGVDLTGKVFYWATLDSSGNIILADKNASFGLIYEEAALGGPATVQFRGVGKCLLAETLAPGALVGPDDFGKTVGHSTAGFSAGMLLTGGVAGNIVSVKIF